MCLFRGVFVPPPLPCKSLHSIPLHKHSCICNLLVEHLEKWCLKEFTSVSADLVVEFHLTAYQGRRILGSSPAIRHSPVHLQPFLYYKILSLM
jgi:hypothetical protein